MKPLSMQAACTLNTSSCVDPGTALAIRLLQQRQQCQELGLMLCAGTIQVSPVSGGGQALAHRKRARAPHLPHEALGHRSSAGQVKVLVSCCSREGPSGSWILALGLNLDRPGVSTAGKSSSAKVTSTGWPGGTGTEGCSWSHATKHLQPLTALEQASAAKTAWKASVMVAAALELWLCPDRRGHSSGYRQQPAWSAGRQELLPPAASTSVGSCSSLLMQTRMMAGRPGLPVSGRRH